MRRHSQILMTFALLLVSGALFVGWLGNAKADQPSVYLIERFLTNQVLVHFDTEPNRTYILQYTSSLSSTSHWSNLFTGPALPFPGHYVIPDTGTAPQRFYRLMVRP